MPVSWIPGITFTKSQEVYFVQGTDGESMERGIITTGKMQMKDAASSAVLVSLREVCNEIGSTVPDYVPVELGLAYDWATTE